MKKEIKVLNESEISIEVLKNMINTLEGLSTNDNLEEVEKEINMIIKLQSEDGSFRLIKNYPWDKDARYEFCKYPTILVTAMIIKLINANECLYEKYNSILNKSLEYLAKSKLSNKEYMVDRYIDNLKLLIKSGLLKFLDNHKDICTKFSKMINELVMYYYETNNEEIIRLLVDNGYLHYMFVYGTLQKGQSNHHFLKYSKYVDDAMINGYCKYDLGYYPGVKPKRAKSVNGELYLVDNNTLRNVDSLEGEGYLYIRTKVKCITNDREYEAYTYVYNRELDESKEVKYEHKIRKDNYVWYVSYGSNMLLDRLMCYLTGEGLPEYNIKANCDRKFSDISLPLDSKKVIIPYELYYGDNSNIWNGAPAFLDKDKKGKTYGRAYLITKEQYKHIMKFEGSKYEYQLDLLPIDGIPAVTFTNEYRLKEGKPSESYKRVIEEGLKEIGWCES